LGEIETDWLPLVIG